VVENPGKQQQLRELFVAGSDVDAWLRDWQQRLACDPQPMAERVASMRAVNPAFIPRNHRVHAALQAAENGDCSLFHKLLGILARPYDDQPEVREYGDPPLPSEVVLQTFCGT
jgi:serine/tyrosine/threonine adenylyltransferase